MKKMSPRAVIYTRVSVSNQAHAVSLETQRERCVTYCANSEYEVVRTFADNGESANHVRRPAFQELLAYCTDRKNRISVVVVHDLSRFSRDIMDPSILASLKSAGVSLHSASGNSDDTPTGRFIKSVLDAMDQHMEEHGLELVRKRKRK